ncbi:MAG: hypothetical protein IKG47_03510, partial [Oscillospiraceae bacterium]|nr:hypothetical protein [Oscillospiraceae bacterium]
MDSVPIATVESNFEDEGTLRYYWFQKTFFNDGINETFSFDRWFEIEKETGRVIDKHEDAMGIDIDKFFVIKSRESAIPDPVEIPEQNMYSQEEINEMILDQTQLIRSQEIEVSQAELNWKKAKQTATD